MTKLMLLLLHPLKQLSLNALLHLLPSQIALKTPPFPMLFFLILLPQMSSPPHKKLAKKAATKPLPQYLAPACNRFKLKPPPLKLRLKRKSIPAQYKLNNNSSSSRCRFSNLRYTKKNGRASLNLTFLIVFNLPTECELVIKLCNNEYL